MSTNYHRIYHIHIRKCAGTSLNRAFLTHFSGQTDSYIQLAQKADHRLVFGRHPVVGWNSSIIERGAFAYAFSHLPYHSLALPKRTFTFTFLREPSERVISHFRMLKDMLAESSKHPAMATEAEWAKGDFSEFLDRIPRKHLENQLFMFDPNFEVERALSRLSAVSCVCFVEETDYFLARLNDEFRINLDYRHLRRSRHQVELSQGDRDKLSRMLEAEYDFYHRARTMTEGARTGAGALVPSITSAVRQ